MKTVLITGVVGFCAGHLIKRLRTYGDFRIIGIDLAEKDPRDILIDEYFCIDISDRKKLERIIRSRKPDIIFHLAGATGEKLFEVYQVNFTGSLYLMESVRKYIPESSIVLVGSSAEYGFASSDDFPLTEDHPCRPISAYGISKHAMVLAGTDYVHKYGLSITAARPFNIVGPGITPALVVGAILERMKASINNKDRLVIKMGNLHTQRDFIDVDDAVNAYIKMAQGGFRGEVFNICSGKPYSIRKIVEMIAAFSNLPVEIEHDPALVRLPDIDISYGSFAKAQKAFGFEPTIDIEETLYKTWRHYMER